MDAWPGTLPQYVLVDGYQEEEGDNLLETQPDIGPPITRARSTTAARALNMSLDLSKAQLAILRTFYRTTLINGSLPFTMSAPSETATTYTVKFQKGGHPKVTGHGGGYFRIAMALWILP